MASPLNSIFSFYSTNISSASLNFGDLSLGRWWPEDLSGSDLL